MTRKETIIATILLIIFGTSMHFVHHVPFFNHFLGYIFPVTESVMVLDIVIYIASMVGAVHLANRWRKCAFVQRLWSLWIVLIVIVIIAIGVLTYHAPDWIIFADLG